ncbi:MAG TPA: hypothetical protein VIJ82_01150 [Streptosporangiaceae bacterium]|jgi:hypothetical protein
MAEPRLIRDYQSSLSAQLPASIVDELADGLSETYRSYRRQGLAPDIAAQAAVEEFGEPQVIVDEFARVHPARRTARKLLVTGPAVGACWAATLITSQAWALPVPLSVRILLGLAVIATIGLLAASAVGTTYRLTARAGIAGCAAIAVLDTAMITSMMFAIPSITWITIAAVAASAMRMTFSARTLTRLVAHAQG